MIRPLQFKCVTTLALARENPETAEKILMLFIGSHLHPMTAGPPQTVIRPFSPGIAIEAYFLGGGKRAPFLCLSTC